MKFKSYSLKSSISILFLCCLFMAANAQKHFDISVLYVGFDPSKPMPENLNLNSVGGGTEERFKEAYNERMPSFKALLSEYFTTVKTVDARDYNEAMSDDVDVTIFDQTPTPIKKTVIHRDSVSGAVIGIDPAEIVSDNFDRPSVFIGHTASTIGRSLGSKLDWYCLCLDKYAHHVRTNHEIFKGPLKVSLTIENEPTPDGVYHYYDGAVEPSEIPMWKVNTEGYGDGKGYRVGLVARGWGFEDSPEAEVISSGVCTKDKTAVALGRHGNFFLWGFAGSPDYMTDEAKKVFVNAVVYTDKHANDRIIARKYNEKIATRIYVDELLYYTTAEAYHNYLEMYKKLNEENKVQIQKIMDKQAAGDSITETEKMFLTMDFNPGTREKYMQDHLGRADFISITGMDTLVIRDFLNTNKEYFYSEPEGFYQLKVDEIAKKWRIGNRDIKLIDKAITSLEDGVEEQDAKRVLLRYTLENFEKPEQWRNWFDKNRKNMFFTETGGYIWMINNADANPKVKPRSEQEISEILKQS